MVSKKITLISIMVINGIKDKDTLKMGSIICYDNNFNL